MIELHKNSELSKKQERIYIEFKNRVTGYVRGKISNVHDVEDIEIGRASCRERVYTPV